MTGSSPLDQPLTDLDRELLKQCNKESFYRRSVPFSTALCLVTFWRHRQGQFQRFIALRYLGAFIIGHVIGRVSYLGECRKKFQNLEEGQSAIKTMLSKNKPQSAPIEQQHKRDISLDDGLSRWSMIPQQQPPPPSPVQRPTSPRQDDFNSFPVPGADDQPRPRVYDDLDDAAARRPSRMWDEDYSSKRQDQ